MISLAMAAREENFVMHVGRGVLIDLLHLPGEVLPLGLIGGSSRSVVVLIDETEIAGDEIEGANIGGRLVLKEIAFDCGIVYVGV